MSKQELTLEEEKSLETTNLDSLVGESAVSAADLLKSAKKARRRGKTKEAEHAPVEEAVVEPEVDEPTSMADPKWHDFVMRQFTEDELDPKGRPLVHGLRRVARLLLGPIISSKGKIVQSPTYVPNSLLMIPAVAEYEITFLWSLESDLDGRASYPVTFGGIADIHMGNSDPDYLRHATSTAETKAEGRALRKALGLGRIIASEEGTLVPVNESHDGKIIQEQIDWIDILARRADLNILTILNAKNRDGKVYKSIHELDYVKAIGFTEYISDISNDRSKIQPDWKGYRADWKN